MCCETYGRGRVLYGTAYGPALMRREKDLEEHPWSEGLILAEYRNGLIQHPKTSGLLYGFR